uniref:Uncharacterized protein n=1 Tax=viral metagenome TaxID=1070528 RepID=A0A6H1ZEQ6_9ZZZZ
MDDYIDNLKQEISDLLEICDARRCNACNRYSLDGYCCFWCGHDNSQDEED